MQSESLGDIVGWVLRPIQIHEHANFNVWVVEGTTKHSTRNTMQALSVCLFVYLRCGE